MSLNFDEIHPLYNWVILVIVYNIMTDKNPDFHNYFL